MKWIKRLFCKHLYISREPIDVPETWSKVWICGKCGYVKDVTVQVITGKLKPTEPDDIDLMLARKHMEQAGRRPSID